MMADEPKDQTLEIMRGIRSDTQDIRHEMREIRDDIRGLRQVQDSRTLQLDFLRERVEDLKESTMMALGYSVDAVERKKKLETQVIDLTARVEKLEKAK